MNSFVILRLPHPIGLERVSRPSVTSRNSSKRCSREFNVRDSYLPVRKSSTRRQLVSCSAGQKPDEPDKSSDSKSATESVSTATGDPSEQPSTVTVASSGEEPEISPAPQVDSSSNKADKNGTPATPPPSPSKQQPSKETVQVLLDAINVAALLGPERVDPEDVKLLRSSSACGFGTFWVTSQEAYGDTGEGVLLKGNLRADREKVFAGLRSKAYELFGPEKYELFMVEEPQAAEEDARGGPRVSFLLVRKEATRSDPPSVWQILVSLLLAGVTLGACVELGLATQISRVPPEVIKYFTSPDPTGLDPPDIAILSPIVESALPVAYGVFGINLFHEVAHRLVASQLKVELGVPYFIPNITIGSFGAVTQFLSPCPDRSSKFDLAISGPLAASTLSLAMFAVGLTLSSSPDAAPDLLPVPSLLFQGSLLLGTVCRVSLGYDVMHAALVPIHPLLIAGWCGLTVSALNLLPVGCLDGGRAMQAAFGKGPLRVSGIVTYVMLAIGVLGGTLSLPFGLFVLILQRSQEKPCLNDVSGVGIWRQGGFAALLTLTVLLLLPMWPDLADELGVGLGTSFF